MGWLALTTLERPLSSARMARRPSGRAASVEAGPEVMAGWEAAAAVGAKPEAMGGGGPIVVVFAVVSCSTARVMGPGRPRMFLVSTNM